MGNALSPGIVEQQRKVERKQSQIIVSRGFDSLGEVSLRAVGTRIPSASFFEACLATHLIILMRKRKLAAVGRWR